MGISYFLPNYTDVALASIVKIALWVLEHTMEKSMFLIILDIIKRHEVIWEAMNKMATIVDVLLGKTEQLRKKNAVELSIVKYLRKFTDIPADKKAQLEKDLLTPIKVLFITYLILMLSFNSNYQ